MQSRKQTVTVPMSYSKLRTEQIRKVTPQTTEDDWLNDRKPVSSSGKISSFHLLEDVDEVATVPLLSAKKLAPSPIDTTAHYDDIELGPLQALLHDDDLTEIVVSGTQPLLVQRNGVFSETTEHFADEQHIQRVATCLLRRAGQSLQPGQSLAHVRLPDGVVATITLPPLSANGTIITLRKDTMKLHTVAELVQCEMLSREMAEFLLGCLQDRSNIVISGADEVGKTTLLNALCNCIGNQGRIVTLENVAELRLKQRQVLSLLSSPTTTVDAVNAIPRMLMTHALRMRPQYLIIGECVGEETAPLIQAMYAGQRGVLATLHATSARDTLNRLETLVRLGNPHVTVELSRTLLAHALHVIVFLSKIKDGSHKVTNILKVQRGSANDIKAQSLFYWQDRVLEGKQGTFEVIK